VWVAKKEKEKTEATKQKHLLTYVMQH